MFNGCLKSFGTLKAFGIWSIATRFDEGAEGLGGIYKRNITKRKEGDSYGGEVGCWALLSDHDEDTDRKSTLST